MNEALAFGIAPQTIKAFLVQRLRWAQGTMQLYRSKECPLWIPGLTFKQRLSYLSSFLAYFESFQKLVLILSPVIILGFDIFPMQVAIVPFLLRWAPYFALNIFANQLGGRGVFNYLKTEKYNILKAIIFVEGTFTLFSKKPLEFKVTPKTIGDSVYRQERQELTGYIVILGLIIVAMAFALIKLFFVHSQQFSQESFIIALIWSAYNSFIIYLALREILTKRHERKKYRFPVVAEGEILDAASGKVLVDSTVIDLSITGAGVLADKEAPEETRIMNLKVKPEKFAEFTLPIEKLIQPLAAADRKELDRDRIYQ